MATPLKVWQRWSTQTKATMRDSNWSSPVEDETIANGKCLDMVTPVPGRVSEIRFDDPRRLPAKVLELEKELVKALRELRLKMQRSNLQLTQS